MMPAPAPKSRQSISSAKPRTSTSNRASSKHSVTKEQPDQGRHSELPASQRISNVALAGGSSHIASSSDAIDSAQEEVKVHNINEDVEMREESVAAEEGSW